MNDLANGLLWYLAFIFSVVVHEASHAFTAMKLGDRTAYDGGQVTLDPLPHIKREPIGTIAVPIFSFLVGGWMIGWASAPYDRNWARAYPDRSAMMALAGPLSNLMLVLISGLLIRLGMAFDWFYAPERANFTHVTAAYQDGAPYALSVLLSIMFSLNIILFVFNLIPLPPLDGSAIIPLFISNDKAVRYLDFIHNTPMLFMGLFVAWEIFDHISSPMHTMFLNLLYPGAGYH
ncbi:MAG: hypothetical protein C0622_05985 [Desulfuromonas sp.]|nr:MAG: hypothetical protein C0622_05985 [Desulfuromonas sp.]